MDLPEEKQPESAAGRLKKLEQIVEIVSRSTQGYRELIDSLEDPLFTLSLDGEIVTANRRFADIVGKPFEELIGHRFDEFFDEPSWETAKQAMPLFLEKRHWSGILRARPKKTGGVLYFDCVLYVIVKEGRAAGASGLARDVTRQRQAEEARRISDERYRELFENAHDVIYTLDLEGYITSLNKAGEKITGYPRDEALRMNFADMIVAEYLPTIRRMTERKVAGEDPGPYDLKIISKDGRQVALEVSARLIYLDGRPVGVQGIARDVTERKHLEDQFRQSQKMEAVGRLAGGVAHDFNNLLTIIKGYSDYLLAKFADHEGLKRPAEEINKAADRAAALTRQLLAFSRRQVLAPKVLDLNAAVHNVEKMLRRLIGEDIELRWAPALDLGRVKADPGQVEQVLMNLAVNARDAMPEGGTLSIETVNVRVHDDSRPYHAIHPGQYVLLTMSDTGCGMDAQTRAHIFEPFFTTKEPDKGTGLGLSTVYGIVKQSEGYIFVDSQPGQGAAFRIYLPRVDEPAAGSGDVRHVAEVRTEGSETILLVEDDEKVRQLLTEILRQKGYNVLVAGNGAEALAISDRHPDTIHLLLADIVMPGMSGHDVAKHLVPRRKQMRVLYMSGYTDNEIVRDEIMGPGSAFLQKPFTAVALGGKIREVLGT